MRKILKRCSRSEGTEVSPQILSFINYSLLDNYYLDHSDTCDLDEDSVDRLWLVIRSLKSTEGKYVSSSIFVFY